MFRTLLRLLAIALLPSSLRAEPASVLHIIGSPETPHALKIFVGPNGSFSPGHGSFGVAFRCEASSPAVRLRTEVCEVRRATPQGDAFIVAARARLANTSDEPVSTTLAVTITPEGPAGGRIAALAFARHAFSIEGHPVLIAQSPSRGATLASGPLEPRPFVPQSDASVTSVAGSCRGEMLFDVTLPAGGSVALGFLCPVLPGRRAGEGGALQPDPGLEFYRGLSVDDLFAEAEPAAGGRPETSEPARPAD